MNNNGFGRKENYDYGNSSGGFAGAPNGYGESDNFGSAPNNYGGSDNFGSAPNNYGGSNNFGSAPNNYGGSNNFGSAPNNYGGSNNFVSSSGGYGSNSFTNNEPGYDPNAPLYNPANDAYDPNAPLYRPEMNTYPPSGAVQPKKKGVNIIVPIILLLAVGLAVILVFMGNQKRDLKTFIETKQGQYEMAELEKEAKKGVEDFDFSWSVNGTNQLVLEYKTKQYYEFDAEQKRTFQSTMDTNAKSFKRQMAKSINEIMDHYKLEEFSILYKINNLNGEILYQVEIFASDYK